MREQKIQAPMGHLLDGGGQSETGSEETPCLILEEEGSSTPVESFHARM